MSPHIFVIKIKETQLFCLYMYLQFMKIPYSNDSFINPNQTLNSIFNKHVPKGIHAMTVHRLKTRFKFTVLCKEILLTT